MGSVRGSNLGELWHVHGSGILLAYERMRGQIDAREIHSEGDLAPGSLLREDGKR